MRRLFGSVGSVIATKICLMLVMLGMYGCAPQAGRVYALDMFLFQNGQVADARVVKGGDTLAECKANGEKFVVQARKAGVPVGYVCVETPPPVADIAQAASSSESSL